MLYNLHSFALNAISLVCFILLFLFFFPTKYMYNANLEICLRIYSAGKPQGVIEKGRFDSSLT